MRRRTRKILIIVILAAAALAAAILYFLYSFYVPDEQAEVVGNIRYTDAEIRRMAMPGFKEHNSLYLRFLRNRIELEEVPFINSIEVEYLEPERVRLHANEEYPVGYLLKDGSRYYFNSSGVVTEILEDNAMRQEEEKAKKEIQSEQETAQAEEIEAAQVGKTETAQAEETDTPRPAGTNSTVLQPVPVNGKGTAAEESDTAFRPALTDVSQVSGLTDSAYAAGEQIQTDHTEVFRTLMDLGRLANKLNIRPDEIQIGEEQTLTLRYEDILVNIGTETLLDEKMSRTAAILPQLEGMKGTLHLESFTMSTINIVFSPWQEEASGEGNNNPGETGTDGEDAYYEDGTAGEVYYDNTSAQDIYDDDTYTQEYSADDTYEQDIYYDDTYTQEYYYDDVAAGDVYYDDTYTQDAYGNDAYAQDGYSGDLY